jgi:hypothetical protein
MAYQISLHLSGCKQSPGKCSKEHDIQFSDDPVSLSRNNHVHSHTAQHTVLPWTAMQQGWPGLPQSSSLPSHTAAPLLTGPYKTFAAGNACQTGSADVMFWTFTQQDHA